ncbi:MAG TPA: DNA gyrase inhibitor YacG [Rhodospirillaceae bacterium]|nr:DNA gyrase inhibitor YacG [Rhodospirillaceae bacterium]
MKKEIQEKCKICGKPVTEKFTPFCCARCAQVDLGKWLGGAYAVETQEEPNHDESEGLS